VTQHLGVSPRWLDHIPTGGASGVMALRRAARAVQAGDADIVACIAADANHVESFRQMLGGFSHFARDASYPYGSGGPNSIFAFITAAYMRAHGATREDFGRICVAQRANALKNPNALFKVPLTLEQYMDARPISEPIHLFDCVMPCAGAEAFLVMREERARSSACARAAARRDRAAQRLRRRPGAAARRLARRSRRPLRAGRRAARGDGLRADLRRLSGRGDAAVRGPGVLRERRRPGLRALAQPHPRRRLSRTTPAAASSPPGRRAAPAASSA
jgi:acetyl-CoA acetyltransferase